MARKERFVYNPQSLRYEKVEISTRKKIAFSFLSLLAIAFTLYIGHLLLNPLFPSQNEKLLKQEIIDIKNQYEELDENVDRMAKVVDNIYERDRFAHRLILGMDPIDDGIWSGGIGGHEELSEGVRSSSIGKEISKVTNKINLLERRLAIQSKSLDTILKKAKDKEKMLASIPSIKPINSKSLQKDVHAMSGFGYRIHPIHKVRKFHAGLDFGAKPGTAIVATGDGVVESIKISKTGYGKHIIVNHGYGYKTLYAHLSEFKVKQGAKVKRGEVIGKVGNTGTSTAPHLHYEVLQGNKPVNPIHYVVDGLSPSEYEELVDRAQIGNQSFD